MGTRKRPPGTLSNYPASVRVRLRIRLAGVPAVPLGRLQVGKCDMLTIEELWGYFCAGCKQSCSAFSLSLIAEHPPPCAALIAKEGIAAGSSETFITQTAKKLCLSPANEVSLTPSSHIHCIVIYFILYHHLYFEICLLRMSKSGMIGCIPRDFVAVSSLFQMNSTVNLISSIMNYIIIFISKTCFVDHEFHGQFGFCRRSWIPWSTCSPRWSVSFFSIMNSMVIYFLASIMNSKVKFLLLDHKFHDQLVYLDYEFHSKLVFCSWIMNSMVNLFFSIINSIVSLMFLIMNSMVVFFSDPLSWIPWSICFSRGQCLLSSRSLILGPFADLRHWFSA